MSMKIGEPSCCVPSTVVGVWVGPFLHVGIVSDHRSFNGLPYVISNSARAGHGAEEPWDVFSGGRIVYQVDGLESALPWPVVLTRARNVLCKKWDLLGWNCEHFVREALGIRVESPQLQFVIWGGLGSFLLSSLVLSKKR